MLPVPEAEEAVVSAVGAAPVLAAPAAEGVVVVVVVV